jgi:2-iminobutanoate/2-iminopropanoate deaminase
MSIKKIIESKKAPEALGPYSVANMHGNIIFTAGQLGIDPETGELAPGGIEAETRQALTNIKNVLEAAGADLGDVMKTTVFLRDINDFAKMNGVYAQFFTENFPARSAVQVAALPKDGAVEIETVAIVS